MLFLLWLFFCLCNTQWRSQDLDVGALKGKSVERGVPSPPGKEFGEKAVPLLKKFSDFLCKNKLFWYILARF